MAFIEFENIRIAGIAAGVPKKTINNLEQKSLSKDYDAAAFVLSTGVKERRIDNLTTSDLCYEATTQLMKDLNWEKSEVDAIIFVSQTPDYSLPATACILQDRLGFSKECYASDVIMGCSGWVYGLSYVVSLMSTGSIKKALLMAGDAKKPVESEDPLFGYAGTVTALEYVRGEKGFKFHFGTDGSGFDAIIVPDGGSRNGLTSDSFKEEEFEGRMYTRLEARMKGMDVFSFGISTAPKSVKKLSDKFDFDYLSYDYFVFHQANMKMNNFISKKLKLDPEKVPTSMYNFGNTSSASIPLTIVTQLQGKFENNPTKFICCGFGVGLSWGTVAFETNDIVISNLVEI